MSIYPQLPNTLPGKLKMLTQDLKDLKLFHQNCLENPKMYKIFFCLILCWGSKNTLRHGKEYSLKNAQILLKLCYTCILVKLAHKPTTRIITNLQKISVICDASLHSSKIIRMLRTLFHLDVRCQLLSHNWLKLGFPDISIPIAQWPAIASTYQMVESNCVHYHPKIGGVVIPHSPTALSHVSVTLTYQFLLYPFNVRLTKSASDILILGVKSCSSRDEKIWFKKKNLISMFFKNVRSWTIHKQNQDVLISRYSFW